MSPLVRPARLRAGVASLAAVATAVALAVTPVQPAEAAVRPPSTQPVAMSWAATYMADDIRYTQAEAEDLARRFDVVAGVPAGLKDHVAAMRAVNPRITLLSYTNGMFLSPEAGAGVPEAEFAHDLLGRRITSSAFGMYLMEPSNTGWRNRSIAMCRDRIALSGFDGCLVDMFGLGIFSKGYLSALPRVPGSTSEYTQQQWSDRTIAFAGQFTSTLTDAVLVANGIGRAARYFRAETPSKPMALSWPGAQAEDYVRGAADPVDHFPTEAAWLQTVAMISDLEANGGSGFYSAKLWTTATAAQIAQWQAYSMATVLMGANGNSFYMFSTERTKAGASGTTAPYRLPRDLGAAKGAMVKDGAVYRRAFDNGLVLVNPTTTSVTYSLSASYRALDGTSKSGTLTLPPNSAQVLVLATTADTTAPKGTIGSATVGSTLTTETAGKAVTVKGWASDNVSVHRAAILVRDQVTGAWLRQDGTWGARQRLVATLSSPGATSTAWQKQLSLPNGRYTVVLVVRDAAGNENPTPRPTMTVTVS